MYGSKFTAVFGESPNQSWGRVLYDITAQELGHGLKACITREEKFPPDAVEFRRLCRPKKHASHKDFLSLPKITTKEERGKNIKKLSFLLKKGKGHAEQKKAQNDTGLN